MSWIKNINLNLNSFCLNIKELEIPDHGITVLMGKSGSGKTTLLKVLIGWHNPNGWSWVFKDKDLSKLAPEDRKLGVLFQENDIFHHLSVKENLLFAAKLKKENELFDKLISLLDLEKSLDKIASSISGGERQRVALANAIISKPNILLLDEPFNSLDVSLRKRALKLTLDVIKEFKIPALLITHDESHKLIANKLINIYKGEIVGGSES